MDNRYIGSNDSTLAAATIESAARMAVVGAVPQMTLSANNAAGAAITQRTSFAQPGGIIRSVDESGNYIMESKERFARQFALWIMPLYQSANGFGMEAGNFDYDFSGALGGVALGADYTFENMLRLGVAFNIGGGYAQGGGDLNRTKNNMNFWGIGAYAGWSRNNFGLSADVNYTSTYKRAIRRRILRARYIRHVQVRILEHCLNEIGQCSNATLPAKARENISRRTCFAGKRYSHA